CARVRGVSSIKEREKTSMRMSRIEKSVVCFCLALTVMVLLASGAFAQSTTDGAISGVVTDQSGAVVPGANATALNLGTGASASGKSDEGGRFLITHLAPGVYS